MRFSKKEMIGGVLFASALLGGCSDSAISSDKGEPCQALDKTGQILHPTSYPEGTVRVDYQEARVAFNKVEHSDGKIVKTNGSYVLKLAALPEKLTNDYMPDFHGTKAVVIISQPEMGSVGLTPNCIHHELNEFGIPSINVELPTQSSNAR